MLQLTAKSILELLLENTFQVVIVWYRKDQLIVQNHVAYLNYGVKSMTLNLRCKKTLLMRIFHEISKNKSSPVPGHFMDQLDC